MSNLPSTPEPGSNLPAVPDQTPDLLGLQTLTWCSFDTTSEAGKLLFMQAATGTPTYDGDKLMNTPFPMQHLFVARITLADTDGNETEADRVVMISPPNERGEMETAAFVSKGIKTSLGYIMSSQMFGKPPWQKPVWVMTQRVPTRSGFKCWNLKVVAPPAESLKK